MQGNYQVFNGATYFRGPEGLEFKNGVCEGDPWNSLIQNQSLITMVCERTQHKRQIQIIQLPYVEL